MPDPDGPVNAISSPFLIEKFNFLKHKTFCYDFQNFYSNFLYLKYFYSYLSAFVVFIFEIAFAGKYDARPVINKDKKNTNYRNKIYFTWHFL